MMILLPEIKKVDELYGIIYLPLWLYKSKYVRFPCYCYPILGIGYMCRLLHYAFIEMKSVTSIDILLAGLCVQVILACLSILNEEKSISEINQMQVRYFWGNNFLNEREKRRYDQIAKISVYLHYAWWLITVLVATAYCTASYFPQAIYNENWLFLSKFFAKIYGYLLVLFGYYVGTAHESFFAYTILHGYLQMITLKAYLRQEFRRYETMYVNNKVNSYKYQTLIEGVFLRCIKQHKRIASYGSKIMNIYNRWMVFHIVYGVVLFSLVFYNYIYDPCGCEFALIMVFVHLALGGIFYHIIGGLFSDSYEDFHNELLYVNWYSFNKTNRRLYYMFIMFTKRKYEIGLWPSLPIDRSLLLKFIKWIYTGVAVLGSLKNHM